MWLNETGAILIVATGRFNHKRQVLVERLDEYNPNSFPVVNTEKKNSILDQFSSRSARTMPNTMASGHQ